MFWFHIQYAVPITPSAIIFDDMNALEITCPQEHRARRYRKNHDHKKSLTAIRALSFRADQVTDISPLPHQMCFRFCGRFSSGSFLQQSVSTCCLTLASLAVKHPCSASVWLRSKNIAHIQPFVPLLWPYERRINDCCHDEYAQGWHVLCSLFNLCISVLFTQPRKQYWLAVSAK